MKTKQIQSEVTTEWCLCAYVFDHVFVFYNVCNVRSVSFRLYTNFRCEANFSRTARTFQLPITRTWKRA